MIRDALISDCGKYRYRLHRKWVLGDIASVLWIMLNPSTADAWVDDPTIRRCIEFSKSWGYGSMWVGNLYAYRATEPGTIRELGGGQVCMGVDNAFHLHHMASRCELIVCAWGASVHHIPDVLVQVPRLPDVPVRCLGRTLNGSPRHPLYLPHRTTLEDFTP